MLTDEVNCYGLAIINITRCIAERVSDRSRCDLNRNTRDSLPWFFFILSIFIYTHEGAGLIDFFLHSLGRFSERLSDMSEQHFTKGGKKSL